MQIKSIQHLNKQALDAAINNGPGYWLGKMAQGDLSLFRGLVFDQYLHALQMVSPEHVAKYADAGMDNYHNIHVPQHFDHGCLWAKPSRMLGPQACNQVMQTEFFKALIACLGNIAIADEEAFGWPGIYWRLVRPGNNDVGPIHADEWFWALGHGDMPEGYYRLKAWICLYAEVGLSGLRVVPESHRKDDWKYHGEMRNGMVKPVLDEQEEDLKLVSLPLSAGDFVLFHDKLLHGGMPNRGSLSRVSLEFTLLVPES